MLGSTRGMSKGLQLHWAISTAVASADFLAFTVGKTVGGFKSEVQRRYDASVAAS
jgi:hypothetical protein